MKLFLLLILMGFIGGTTAGNPRLKRQSDAEEELAEALLKRVEALLFYVQDPSAELEEFFVSAIQVAAKYHLERLVRTRIILFEIKETVELEDIIANHPGGNDEAFAEGMIDWAEKYKSKFEALDINGSNTLGKVNQLAFDRSFRDADRQERLDYILEILRSDAVHGEDSLRLGDADQ